MRYLITGATGFVGGHLADACARREHTVTALVRASSNTGDLDKLGAILFRGELSDAALVRQAVSEADVVVHCAAKVGDWGPVEEYRQVNVEALRVLLDACKGQALSRFIHVSSLGVYAYQHHYGTDETTPLPSWHSDGYSQSKVEAEQLAQRYYNEFGVPVVILRPGFVYGPRDRTVMPRIIDGLREGRLRYPGGGEAALNTIYIDNLIDAIFLAVENDKAVGSVYNLTDGEFVSKRKFIEAVADAMGLPHPTRTPPLWLARLVTWISELYARLRGATEAPYFNFTRLKFMGYNLEFSIQEAMDDLGYRPRVKFDDAISETMAWYKSSDAQS
ncbi:MAG: NAD-dependent epimerase/dehydratase family protein [Planctomycetes bacterium]|nr:NAD-dependent epimerase/dehydratase family protein [Planctomycetota bacterium]